MISAWMMRIWGSEIVKKIMQHLKGILKNITTHIVAFLDNFFRFLKTFFKISSFMIHWRKSYRFETTLGRVNDYSVLISGWTKPLMILKQASFSISINSYFVERLLHVLHRFWEIWRIIYCILDIYIYSLRSVFLNQDLNMTPKHWK